MHRVKRIMNTIGVLILLMSTLSLPAQQPGKTVNWDSWRFLLGEWVGDGEGTPGQGTGECKFYLDLQDTILVRTSYAEYPAAKDRPGFSHKDLMIIYQVAGTSHAVYFDNEGHVINYTAEFSQDLDTLTFTSEIKPSEPRFRLTYSKEPDKKLKLKFEFAPPGKPEAFSMYIEAILKKKV
jgi:hypothetical protein